jgi:acyl-CoA synthetase (AMP-forming)/AMP-acid ligase II
MRIEAEAQPAVEALEGMLARGAGRSASRVVASSATCQLSFGELFRDADEVRRRLRRRDGRGAVAAVMLDGSAGDLVAIFGVLLAGWHLVALRVGGRDPVLEGLEPDAVVTRGAVRLCSSREPEGFQRELTQRPEPHVLVTSSGSTNRPTTVGFSLRHVCERAGVESSELRSDDVVAMGGSAHGSLAGITLALAALERGACLAFIGTGSSPADTIALGLGSLGVTRWSCSATLLAAVLARKGENPVSGLRRIEVRGEELSRPLARTALQAWAGAELCHTYGLTESGQGCSWRATAEDVRCRSFVPIGSTRLDPHVAVDGGQIVITDGRPPRFVGSRGRTPCFGGRSPTLATGDAGRVHADGTVEYRGRIGERLAAADGAITPRAAARRVMRAFPQTHAVGVAGTGVVCMSADRSLDAGLAAATRNWGFPVVRLEDPPRSSSGKLDCAALETMLRSPSAVDRRARRTAHEQ